MPRKQTFLSTLLGRSPEPSTEITNDSNVVDPVRRAVFPYTYFDQGLEANQRHDIYGDYGYPYFITFEQLHRMYRRNALAYASVEAVVNKCYQSYPMLTHTDEGVDETPQEQLVRMHLRKIRFWQLFIESDRRMQVGGYSGLILRIADGKRMDEPVDGGFAGVGIEAIVEVIPAWRGQLEVSKFHYDVNDPMYGKPASYIFTEAQVLEPNQERQQPRAFEVHPDRVLIFSRDGTIYNESDLEAGFNALLDCEKVLGAGAEGFWRNARGAPFFEVDKEINTAETHRGVGASNADNFTTVMTQRVRNYLKGWSNYLMIKGVKPHFPNVALPNPEFYFKNNAQYFASSRGIPYRVLLGNETGERASTEDAREWAQTCMSRREEMIVPIIDNFIMRLQDWGAIDMGDWRTEWSDLTDSTAEEKAETASKMSSMNSQNVMSAQEKLFTSDEIREVMGYEPLSEDDKFVETFDDPELSGQASGGKNAK